MQVLLGGDGGDPLLRPPLLLLHGDGAIVVRPVLEDASLSFQLPDGVEKSISSSRQHEVEIKID